MHAMRLRSMAYSAGASLCTWPYSSDQWGARPQTFSVPTRSHLMLMLIATGRVQDAYPRKSITSYKYCYSKLTYNVEDKVLRKCAFTANSILLAS